MKKYIFTFDSAGYYVNEKLRLEDDKYNCKESETDMPMHESFIKPRWDGEKWVEGGESPEPTPPQPTDNQILGQQITDLEISDIIQGQQITDLEIKILIMEVHNND